MIFNINNRTITQKVLGVLSIHSVHCAGNSSKCDNCIYAAKTYIENLEHSEK